MQKIAVACLYASIIIFLFGTLDRMTGAKSFLAGVAPEAYWKGGMMLLTYAVVFRFWGFAQRGSA
ncbi:MAG: hypothetical protein ACT4PE_13805 [Candidatus Eiseniibacteriota bacterium]